MQGTNPENQEKVLELIKYSSPTDVEYLSVVVEPKLTANKDKYNKIKTKITLTRNEKSNPEYLLR